VAIAFRLALLSLIMVAPLAGQAAPPAVKTLEIGASAPDFSLPGVDGKTYSLQDFSRSPVLLLIFTCNHCPTAQAYEDRIIQLQADYAPQGVAVVAVSPNDDKAIRLDELGYTDLSDSFEEMKIRAEQKKFAFPYLYDGETQQMSQAYGPVATPQCFLFDQARKLRYLGRIDDSDVKTVTSHDVRNALDAVLAGKPVPVEKTRTFGCSTKWSDKRPEVARADEKAAQEPVTLSSINEQELRQLVRNETEDLLMINVWATWCGPCVQELPELVAINRMYRGRNFRLVTLSMDDQELQARALKVLQKSHASTTNYISALPTQDALAEALDPQWSGALPYTVLIAPGGKVVFRQENQIVPAELKGKIVEILGRTYINRKKK